MKLPTIIIHNYDANTQLSFDEIRRIFDNDAFKAIYEEALTFVDNHKQQTGTVQLMVQRNMTDDIPTHVVQLINTSGGETLMEWTF